MKIFNQIYAKKGNTISDIKEKTISSTVLSVVKVLVTISLCLFILANADWDKILFSLRKSNVWLILLVFTCMVLNMVISSLKWQFLLKIHGMSFKLVSLTRYYFTAMFFNNFLPSTIGGDGYRIYKVIKGGDSKSKAVLSVFSERFFGVFVLFTLGFLGAGASYFAFGDHISLVGIIFGALGIFISLVFICLLTMPRSQQYIQTFRFIPKIIKNNIEHLGDYHRNPSLFAKFIGVSVFYYLFMFSYRLLLIYAVGESCSYFSLMLVVMVSNVLAILPISINGIGLLDGSFIYLISKFGVGYEGALMVMILLRSLALLLSLIGGIVYYTEKDVKKIEYYQKDKHESLKESDI